MHHLGNKLKIKILVEMGSVSQAKRERMGEFKENKWRDHYVLTSYVPFTSIGHYFYDNQHNCVYHKVKDGVMYRHTKLYRL